jgi:hypothetical protein
LALTWRFRPIDKSAPVEPNVEPVEELQLLKSSAKNLLCFEWQNFLKEGFATGGSSG